MQGSTNIPRIFISYSWKPASNKRKTLDLAERLSNDGVHVILDEWDLSEGQDKFNFMEQMVNNSDIKRVLLICNKDYTEKANQREGGVGTESLIISQDIYSQAEQKKFIPVLFERDEKGKELLPTFINSRIYIDLSSEDIFEDEYQKLLRNIFDKPATKRPAIGSPPAYLFQEIPVFLPTANKALTIKNALINDKRNYQIFIDDYYSSFLIALKEFEITEEEIKNLKELNKIDELVLDKIDKLKLLRDDYILFLDVLVSYSHEINIDKFIRFIEKLILYFNSFEIGRFTQNNIAYIKIDQFKFFYYEFFLYTVSVFVEKEKYKELSEIISTTFLLESDRHNTVHTENIVFFNKKVNSLDKHRNERLSLNRVSIVADLLKQRADNLTYSFTKISQADALLYYISITTLNSTWFPYTTAYHLYNIPLLDKMISNKYFEKVKSIFAVNSIDELKQKVDIAIQKNYDGYRRWNFEFPYLNKIFDFSRIGKLP